MALIVNTNMASLNAQRNLSSSQKMLSRSMERLSTGLRINSGQDDSAGLALSSRLTGQIRGFQQVVRNANDGVSFAKIGDGGLKEIENMIQRIRELTVQKGNGALDTTSIDAEITALAGEITTIEGNSTFNGTSALDAAAVSFALDADGGSLYDVSLTTAVAVVLTAASTVADADTALDAVATARGQFGTHMTALEAHSSNAAIMAENLTAARSQIMDADIAMETAAMTKHSIMQQAGIAVLAQANQAPQAILSLLS